MTNKELIEELENLASETRVAKKNRNIYNVLAKRLKTAQHLSNILDMVARQMDGFNHYHATCEKSVKKVQKEWNHG